MNTSDNPGLWDIQFSSWDLCESNAKVMSLINRLFLGFRASHEVHEYGFLLASIRRLPVTIHALVTNGDSAGYSCDRPRTHAIATTNDFYWQDRQRFSLSLLASHTRKREWTHTHTQRDKLWRWTSHTTSGMRLLHDPAFQRFTLISDAASESFLLLENSVTNIRHLLSYELSAKLQLSAAFTSHRLQTNQSLTDYCSLGLLTFQASVLTGSSTTHSDTHSKPTDAETPNWPSPTRNQLFHENWVNFAKYRNS